MTRDPALAGRSQGWTMVTAVLVAGACSAMAASGAPTKPLPGAADALPSAGAPLQGGHGATPRASAQAEGCSRPPRRAGRDAEQVMANALWHLDASIRRTLKLGQGTEVLAWHDVRGTGLHATAAVPAASGRGLRPLAGPPPSRAVLPRLMPGALAGADAVRFSDGAALQIPARDWGPSFTAIVVVQARAPHAERYARILDIATNALLAGPSAKSGALAISVNPYPRPVTYHPFGSPGSAVIAWAYHAGCELVLLNGAVAVDLRDDAAYRLEGPIGIGNLLVNPNPSYWFHGDVGEVLVFDTALPHDELAAVSTALRAKWRL